MAQIIDSKKFVNDLQKAGIIPKDLSITKITLIAEIDKPLKIVCDSFIDSILGDHITETLIVNKDKLIAKKVSERLKG
jgi:hypothetical protein